MSHQAATGLFLHPDAGRRAAFDAACAASFARLLAAGSSDEALALLQGETVDLLVIDLEGIEPELDGDALARLVAARAGAPVFVLCPAANARWLPRLTESGPLGYALTPLDPARLAAAVAAFLAGSAAPRDLARELAEAGELAVLRRAVHAALAANGDLAAMGTRLCAALCGWRDVSHAGLFVREPDGDLRLAAQYGAIDLARLLGRGERLASSPLRHAFPGLAAAATGSIALLDDPDQAGEPALGAALRAQGAAMVLGLPIPGHEAGAAPGSLCLLLTTARGFSGTQFSGLAELADLAGIGLRLAHLAQQREAMQADIAELATRDHLTGLANRRHGETLLETEIKRARRHRLPLAVVAFDIDRFSEVNTRYGLLVGDVVLRSVARAVGEVLRASDILVRAGDEEFLVIAPHAAAADGLKLAEKLRAAIAATVIPGADAVTVSLGVAQLGEEESADALTVRAQAALGRAKRAGRNRVELAMG